MMGRMDGQTDGRTVDSFMRNNVHTVNSRNDFSHNDSTINIVKAIIVIINAIRYDTIRDAILTCAQKLK